MPVSDKVFHLSIVILAVSGCIEASTVGLEYFFRDNFEEFRDRPIQWCNSTPVPHWVHGTFVRNGPGRFNIGQRSVIHTFDGFAKLHSFKIHNGTQIHFSASFLGTSTYTRSIAENDYATSLTFDGVNPAFTFEERAEALVYGIDNTNANIWKIGSGRNAEFIGLTDAAVFSKFDVGTLSTISLVKPDITHPIINLLSLMSTAHPLYEPKTGHTINLVYTVNIVPGLKHTLTLYRMKDTSTQEIIANVKLEKMSYMHSFSITENHAIVSLYPLYISVPKMLNSAEAGKCLEWEGKDETKFLVISLKDGKVSELMTPGFFAVHHVNAFEQGDDIVVDIITYPDNSMLYQFELATMLDEKKRSLLVNRALLKRFTLNTKTSSVGVSEFPPKTPDMNFVNRMELPVINENHRSGNYCYVYGVVFSFDEQTPTVHDNFAIVKKDLCNNGRSDKYWYLPNHYPNEPYFIPEPNAKAEDQGVLVTTVLDGERKESYLLILDAQTLKIINYAYAKTYIPFAIHGRFFPGDF
ncbi:PREDICTED: carotenoid isomerooxygenase-like [Branchiostoma belcheri]|uniref:Carotenoid isomerooxygenase-like n=1 Tax=Branchiostoma belcheri TaxID=7741 RepID=A0A6P4Z8J6_BRABE|nr:PREDICTED: carotenoid isomerooxygenase-like [Branchiostoma belcheri]